MVQTFKGARTKKLSFECTSLRGGQKMALQACLARVLLTSCPQKRCHSAAVYRPKSQSSSSGRSKKTFVSSLLHAGLLLLLTPPPLSSVWPLGKMSERLLTGLLPTMETANKCLLRPDLLSTPLSISSFYPNKCFPTEAKIPQINYVLCKFATFFQKFAPLMH